MPFMNIRTKNFFWGDGDKVCWNDSRLAQSRHKDYPRMAFVAIVWNTVVVANRTFRLSSGTRRSTTTRRLRNRLVRNTRATYGRCSAMGSEHCIPRIEMRNWGSRNLYMSFPIFNPLQKGCPSVQWKGFFRKAMIVLN